jgi:hypothetical protein
MVLYTQQIIGIKIGRTTTLSSSRTHSWLQRNHCSSLQRWPANACLQCEQKQAQHKAYVPFAGACISWSLASLDFFFTDLPMTKFSNDMRSVLPQRTITMRQCTCVHTWHAHNSFLYIRNHTCPAPQANCKALHPYAVERDTRRRSSVCQCLIIQASTCHQLITLLSLPIDRYDRREMLRTCSVILTCPLKPRNTFLAAVFKSLLFELLQTTPQLMLRYGWLPSTLEMGLNQKRLLLPRYSRCPNERLASTAAATYAIAKLIAAARTCYKIAAYQDQHKHYAGSWGTNCQ